MYKHILLPTDGSDIAQRAVTDGLALAKALGAKVTVITIIRPWHTVAPAEVMISFPEEEYLTGAKQQAEQILEKVETAAKAAGVPCTTCHAMEGEPWRAITKAATDKDCDLIAMASHGRTGLAELFLGSETQKVLAHSKVPVLVHR